MSGGEEREGEKEELSQTPAVERWTAAQLKEGVVSEMSSSFVVAR